MSILYLLLHCGINAYNSRLLTFPPHTYRLTHARATNFLPVRPVRSREKYRKNTHRYFLGFSVSLCCATEKPKKLPLVFPSFITGKRTSTLNPRHVCAVYNMQKQKCSRVLGAIFRSLFLSFSLTPLNKLRLSLALHRNSALSISVARGGTHAHTHTLRSSRSLGVYSVSPTPCPFTHTEKLLPCGIVCVCAWGGSYRYRDQIMSSES